MTPETSPLHPTPGRVLENRPLGGDFFLLRLHAPGMPHARPGQFVHVTCGAGLTLPRPFSVLDHPSSDAPVDILYRVTGQGTLRMTTWKAGHVTPLLGPIGQPFTPLAPGDRALLVAGGAGLAPLDFLVRQPGARDTSTTLLWGLESDPLFPTHADEARPGLPKGLALRHLHARGIVSRLTSLTERPGFFRGYVTELVARHLEQISPEERARTTLRTCGPLPMMAALAALAKTFGIRGEASLEARMACGFGACVGCVAPVHDRETWRYQRVCVDGPVFPLEGVDWVRLAGGVSNLLVTRMR